jgi:uncharacterized protein YfdQ (DUF2303 family)
MADSPQLTNTQAALTAGESLGRLKMAGEIRTLGDGTPFLLVPDGVQLKFLESTLPHPTRRKGVVTLHDAASFVAYVTRYADATSIVFSDLQQLAWTAVLDYHAAAGVVVTPDAAGPSGVAIAATGAAGWGQHRATFATRPTAEWKAWTGKNGKPTTQVDFARFLEDHLPDIAMPDGAVVLEVARTLEAHTAVKFASSVRLDNGEYVMQYEETITGTAKKGTVQIPSSFTLALRPFEGAAVRSIEARFRYRIASGELTLWYDLLRPEVVLEEAFATLRAQVADGIGTVPLLAGTAPAL